MLTSYTRLPPRQASICLQTNQLVGNSVEAARRVVTLSFRNRGLDTPELDARLLIAYALGCRSGKAQGDARGGGQNYWPCEPSPAP